VAAYAFSRHGTAALRRLRGRRLLTAFESDGALAPIALRPEQVDALIGEFAAGQRSAVVVDRSLRG
jgi:hypothetical protein